MKYARTINSTAIDTRTGNPEGFFTHEIAVQFQQVPDNVQDGWLLNNGSWQAPTIPEPVTPAAPEPAYPKVSPIEFKLLFTSSERVAIKKIDNDIIKDFFELVENQRIVNAADATRGMIDFGLHSTRDALGYMASVGLLTPERVAEILIGVIK